MILGVLSIMHYFRCARCDNVYAFTQTVKGMTCGGGCEGELEVMSQKQLDLHMEQKWKSIRKSKEQVRINRYL